VAAIAALVAAAFGREPSGVVDPDVAGDAVECGNTQAFPPAPAIG